MVNQLRELPNFHDLRLNLYFNYIDAIEPIAKAFEPLGHLRVIILDFQNNPLIKHQQILYLASELKKKPTIRFLLFYFVAQFEREYYIYISNGETQEELYSLDKTQDKNL